MKPVKLILNAFGPFLKRQELSFEDLGENLLFAITGPTGSGKTTIFDAIAFALYGEASGVARSINHFRSDFAQGNEVCFVQFTFSLKGELYQIERIPKQLRQGRGGSMSERTSTAALTLPDGAVLTGVLSVNAKIRDLLGLDANQFRQIVLLPQGEFNRFLTSDSGEKQTIFRRIFSTGIYERIETLLRQKSTQYDAILSELHLKQKTHLSLVQPVSENLACALQAEYPHFPSIIALLEQQNQDDASTLSLIQEELCRLQKERNALNLPGVRQHNILCEQLKEAQKKWDQLQKELPLREKEKDQLEKARQAEPIFQKENNWKKAKQNKEQLKSQLTFLLEKEPQIESDYLYAQELAKKIDQDREKLSILFRQQAQLEVQIQQTNRKKEVKTALEEAEHHLETAKKQLAGILLLTHRAQCRHSFEETRQKRKKGEALRKEIAENANRKRLFSLAQLRLDEANQARMEGQAILLAQNLTPGNPCPVCGALEHPAPACGEKSIPDESLLQRLKQEADGARSQYERQEAALLEKASQLMALPSQIELPALHERILEELSLWEADERKEKERWKRADQQCQAQSTHPEKLSSPLFYDDGWLETQHHKWETDVETCRISLGSLQKQWDQLEETTSSSKLTPSDLEGKRQEINKEITYLSEKEKHGRLHLQEALTVRERFLGEKKQVQLAEIEAEKAEKALKSEYENALTLSSFEKESLYQAARMTPEAFSFLEQQQHSFSLEEKLLEGQVSFLKEKVGDLPPQDLISLEKKAACWEEEIQKKGQAEKRTQIRLENNNHLLQKLKDEQATFLQQEEKRNQVSYLSQIALGKDSSHISLERFVLMHYFSQMVKAANFRLSPMTGNRYQLIHHTQPEKNGAKSGLSLYIFDSYTGKERPTNTLSGGESFQVSLALSLGLSDVIQNEAGGIHIDTMFIDEGFGTLDQMAMDNAISSLQKLGGHGHLIGVISHVEELKERIPAHLEISLASTGSKAKFQIN